MSEKLPGRPKGSPTMPPEARQIIWEVFRDRSITVTQATAKVTEKLRQLGISRLPSPSAIKSAYHADRRNDDIYTQRDRGRRKGPGTTPS